MLAACHSHAVHYRLGQTRVVQDHTVFYTVLKANKALSLALVTVQSMPNFITSCVFQSCVSCVCGILGYCLTSVIWIYNI